MVQKEVSRIATKDYAAIARSKIIRPAEVTRHPKFLIYGRNKKGKSTFCASAGQDKVLFADPEHGTTEMKEKNPHVWPIEKWEDLDDYYNFLRAGSHEYQWAALDGLTRMSNMALNYVMRIQEEKSLDRIPGMVQQRDYGKSGELMRAMLTNFHNLPMGVIYTAQERMEEGVDSEEDVDAETASAMYVPDLPKGVRGMVNSLVDVIGRIYVVKVEDAQGNARAQRRLWLGESLKYDTGYRSDFDLPDYMPAPTVPKLVRAIRTGSTTREK
jgi:hypothetical protein